MTACRSSPRDHRGWSRVLPQARRHRARGRRALRRAIARACARCSAPTLEYVFELPPPRAAPPGGRSRGGDRRRRPSGREMRSRFADLVGFTKLGERLEAGRDRRAHRQARRAGPRRRPRPVRLVKTDRRRRDARLARRRELLEATLDAGRDDEEARASRCCARASPGGRVDRRGRRLLRPPGEPREPDHRRRPSRQRARRPRRCDEARARTSSAGPTPAASTSRGSAARSRCSARGAPGEERTDSRRADGASLRTAEASALQRHGPADALRAGRGCRHGAVAMRAPDSARRALGRRHRRAPPPARRRHRPGALLHLRDRRPRLRDRRARPARRHRPHARDRRPRGLRRLAAGPAMGDRIEACAEQARPRPRAGPAATASAPGCCSAPASGSSTRPAPGRSSPG